MFPSIELRTVRNILPVGITLAKKSDIIVDAATMAKAQAKTYATSLTVISDLPVRFSSSSISLLHVEKEFSCSTMRGWEKFFLKKLILGMDSRTKNTMPLPGCLPQLKKQQDGLVH